MTETRKKVVRVTMTDTVRDRGKNRKIVARIGPGDVISFRLKGLYNWTAEITLKELFYKATYRTVLRNWKEENESRKALGRRLLKKPRSLET